MKHFKILLFLFLPLITFTQIDQSKMGAWYMYFFNTSHKSGSIGFQGDIQHRNWNFIGDLEQLLLRGGLTFKPKNEKVKFTLGYGNISTGTYGENNSVTNESRIYQEVLFPNTFFNRLYFTHRFRYEQRFLKEQTLRTRYRYNLFLNIPINQPTMQKNTVYLALYNELFINGQKEVNGVQTVEFFDRNRLYAAIGYFINDQLKIQIGMMNQSTNNWGKNQLQFSIHHVFQGI